MGDTISFHHAICHWNNCWVCRRNKNSSDV